MKAVFHLNDSEHQAKFGAALREGLRRHGVEVRDDQRQRPADIVVLWGWKRPSVIEQAQRQGSAILVMERGHLQPRMVLASLGWNGLAGRATYAKATDGGERWRKMHAEKLRDWRLDRDGFALLCGQVDGDASLRDLVGGFPAWAQRQTDALRHAGWRVVYRPHPLSRQGAGAFCPDGAEMDRGGTLDAALAGAGACVTYNSTAGVEAVLAGVPTVATDAGSMAWPVASHEAGPQPLPSVRTGWCHDMAWTSWTRDEIADGTAVDALLACRQPAETADAA